MRIAAVYDTRGWCWYYQALDLARHAPEEYIVTPMSSSQYSRIADLSSDYDAVLFFSWPESPEPDDRMFTVLAHHGCEFDYHEDSQYWPQLAAATPLRNKSIAKQKLPRYAGVISVNPRLHQVALNYGANSIYLPAGVDTDTFRHYGGKRDLTDRRLRVGWCGQYEGKPNTKGYDWIVRPVMEKCKEFAEFDVLTRTARDALTRGQMVKWYNGLDVFLCTSIAEGTPMPPLEAMACGVPIVSTSVGDLPERCDDGISSFLVGTYTDSSSAKVVIDFITRQLCGCRESLNGLRSLGSLARAKVATEVDWRIIAPKWLKFIADNV